MSNSGRIYPHPLIDDVMSAGLFCAWNKLEVFDGVVSGLFWKACFLYEAVRYCKYIILLILRMIITMKWFIAFCVGIEF